MTPYSRFDPIRQTTEAKSLWLHQFHRILLTRRPALRWSIDSDMVDQFYAKRLDPVIAAHRYLDLH